MQLVINTPGSTLRVKEGCFYIKTPVIPRIEESADPEPADKQVQISVGKVQSILISTQAFLTTDAIKLAVDNNIDIIFLNQFGAPYGRVWHCRMGSTAAIRRKQLEIAETESGLQIVIEYTSRKINNQLEFIEKLLRARKEKESELTSSLSSLKGLIGQVQRIKETNTTIADKRNEIMGLEGTAGRIYFQSISALLPDRWQFTGRTRAPAKDPFNCMLNYAYGVFYSLVEKSCVIAGLDPYIGFLHTDNYGKPSLVFDLIEPYRYLADATVFYLFSGRQVKQEYFDEIPGGITLNKEGKAVLLTALNEVLDKPVRYSGRNLKPRDIIQFDCHKLANKLLGKEKDDFQIELKEF
ncbi:MAG: CRISPR-associated endonuclease Cas1 [bacterium]